MPFNFSIYAGILISSAIASFLVALALFSKYKEEGKYASVLLCLTGWWSFTSALCLMQKDLNTLSLIVDLQYFSVALFPAFWGLFVLNHLRGRISVNSIGKAILFIVPLVTLVLVFTNVSHHLYYQSTWTKQVNGITFFKFRRGPWYLVHTIYFYCCLAVGLFLLVSKADWNDYFFSRQTRNMLLAAIVPAVANLLYLSGIRPSNGIDLTPFAFTVTSLLIAYSLFKFNLLHLLPVAREKVVESLQEGVIVLDKKDRLVYLNDAMRRVLGETKSLIGLPFSTFFPDLLSDEANNKEIEIRDENSLNRIYSVTFSRLESDANNRGRILLFKDITEQKQVETLLIQAKTDAEQASKAKADFLSTMSHEIRTPMNAVIGFTELLRQNAREDQKEYLSLLKYSGENLLVLINDILDFSKVDAGKLELEVADFDLVDLMNKVKLTLGTRASEKGIGLNAEIDANIPAVLKGDRVRLGQIFTNLVGNAVKFTEKGSVTIVARVLSRFEKNCTISFEVRDTGIGIPADKQQTIFESFTQASSDTTRRFGGTGLGLAICKKLVELHGSSIKLSSEPGEGSSFQFEIEFKVGQQAVVESSSSETRKIITKDLKGLKVLLAEDNKINVLVAKQFLKQWQVECDVAENGRIAVEMVQSKDYDMVLMDLQMPEVDGYEATRTIRQLPNAKYKNLPVIALSAAALAEEKDKVYQYGMNDFITKPFKPEELLEKLNLHKAWQ